MTEPMPRGEIDLVLRSTTSAWGPLACLGHEGGVTPGDWWGAFWWAMQERWEAHRVEQKPDEPQEPATVQTTLSVATDGGVTDSTAEKHGVTYVNRKSRDSDDKRRMREMWENDEAVRIIEEEDRPGMPARKKLYVPHIAVGLVFLVEPVE